MKAVIFDMDGVLINTEPLHYECWREVLREEGIEMDFDTYKPCIGSTREYLLELIWDNYGKIGEAQDLMDRMKRKKKRDPEQGWISSFARCAGGNKEIQGRRISSCSGVLFSCRCY